MIFFDSHAKAIRPAVSVKEDYWDALGPNGHGSAAQQRVLASIGSVAAWQ